VKLVLDTPQIESRMASDLSLGATTEDRRARVARAKIAAKVMMFVTIAVSLWGFLYPSPYRTVIAALVLLPLLAIFLMVSNPGLYQVKVRRQDPRPDLSPAVIFPGLALLLRANQDFQLLSWAGLLRLSLFAALILVGVIASSDPQFRERRWPLLVFLLLTPLYTTGALLHANALFDRSPVQLFQPRVRDKHVSHGRSTSYYLQLEPWGPQLEEKSVMVPRTLYVSVAVGDPACVWLRSGALHSPWFSVRGCS
jgi:hypothetical protein